MAEEESDLAPPSTATIDAEAPSPWSEDAQPRPEILAAEPNTTTAPEPAAPALAMTTPEPAFTPALTPAPAMTTPEPALTPAPTVEVAMAPALNVPAVPAVRSATDPERGLTPGPRDFHVAGNPITPQAATRRPASMESLATDGATPSPAAMSSKMRDLATIRKLPQYALSSIGQSFAHVCASSGDDSTPQSGKAFCMEMLQKELERSLGLH